MKYVSSAQIYIEWLSLGVRGGWLMYHYLMFNGFLANHSLTCDLNDFFLQIFCSHELMEEMIEEMDFVQDAEKVLLS